MKKRVRRWGGEDVGCEVSAFRSHWRTEMLWFAVSERYMHVGGSIRGVPYCTVETTRAEPEALTNILKEEISFDFSFQSNLFNRSDFTVIIPPSTSPRYKKLTQHAGSDIDTSPDISLVIEDLT